MRRVRVVDSHTEGEPTRVVVDGGPPLGSGPMSQRRDRLRASYDSFRRAVVTEPRGTDALVGALLCPPEHSGSTAGAIFFNNVGYLSMCGHGTIGVVVTLAHLGRIDPGPHAIDTPAGTVATELAEGGVVAVTNVVSRRWRAGVTVTVPEFGPVTGSVAWGGNWFFLADRSPLPLRRENLAGLTEFCAAVRAALERASITGEDGAAIDHIELAGPPSDPRNSSRNFVLCPGGAYDRSPCGTGTSAAMACRFADGTLAEGEVWRQEGILGGVFEGTVKAVPEGVLPTIRGRAFVTADAELLLDDRDPFRDGIPP
ncbi:MAG TPA: proline racemase family protein [Thermoplasmata archaeon]|nr:proline racemase family protein [Thermoplasmata archaeon]